MILKPAIHCDVCNTTILTVEAWETLTLKGNQCLTDEDHLELRDCSCGNTKARYLPRDHKGRCMQREKKDAR